MKPELAGPFAFAGLMAWIGAGLGQGGTYSLVLWPTSLVLMVLAMLAARRRVLQQDRRSGTTSFASRPGFLAAGMAIGALLGVALVRHEIALACFGAAAVVAVALVVLGVRARRRAQGAAP